MMLLKERVLVLIERCGAVLFFSCLLVCAPVALGDGGGGKDGAYAEVSQNLDSETEAAGRVLYESRCAQCHDANVVRAPQRYILQLSTPEAILSALNDGLMQQVA
jgi:mono/diheme cytochrome c family protein